MQKHGSTIPWEINGYICWSVCNYSASCVYSSFSGWVPVHGSSPLSDTTDPALRAWEKWRHPMLERRSVDRIVQKHICAYQISVYNIRMPYAWHNCATCNAYAQVMKRKAQIRKKFQCIWNIPPFCTNRELKHKGAKWLAQIHARNLWETKKVNPDLLSWSSLSVITTTPSFLPTFLLSLVSLLILFKFSPTFSFTRNHIFLKKGNWNVKMPSRWLYSLSQQSIPTWLPTSSLTSIPEKIQLKFLCSALHFPALLAL